MGEPFASSHTWGRRVVRCAVACAALLGVALCFDVAADAIGIASDGMPDDQLAPRRHRWPSMDTIVSVAITVPVLSLLAGCVTGTILPRTFDPATLDRPLARPGESRTAPPGLMWHSIRRAAIAVLLGSAITVGVLCAALSVTTDIVQDDSPSTLGASGGVAIGAAVGVPLALVAAPLVGIAAGIALDRKTSLVRSIAATFLSSVLVSLIPLAVLFDAAPNETPDAAVVATVGASLVAQAVAAVWMIRWRYTGQHR